MASCCKKKKKAFLWGLDSFVLKNYLNVKNARISQNFICLFLLANGRCYNMLFCFVCFFKSESERWFELQPPSFDFWVAIYSTSLRLPMSWKYIHLELDLRESFLWNSHRHLQTSELWFKKRLFDYSATIERRWWDLESFISKGSFFVFNGISTFVDYLMSKSSL